MWRGRWFELTPGYWHGRTSWEIKFICLHIQPPKGRRDPFEIRKNMNGNSKHTWLQFKDIHTWILSNDSTLWVNVCACVLRGEWDICWKSVHVLKGPMCKGEKRGYSPATIVDFCSPIVDLGDMGRITREENIQYSLLLSPLHCPYIVVSFWFKV